MTQHEDGAQRTYYERRLDEIRSKFRSDAPNLGLEHIDVHFLLSLASMGHEGNCNAERTRLLDEIAILENGRAILKGIIDKFVKDPGLADRHAALVAAVKAGHWNEAARLANEG